MSAMADYTQDEIEKIMATPMIVSMYVMGSSLSGPIGLVKEMMAGVETAIEAGKKAPAGSLFNTLWSEQNMKAQQDKLKQETKQSTQGAKVMTEAKGKMLEDIRGAVAIMTAKGSPDEVQEYKQLVIQVAQKVADAAKEGGFMGIGGVQVNQAEQTAIAEIRGAVGVPA
jgi:hypothetical protein